MLLRPETMPWWFVLALLMLRADGRPHHNDNCPVMLTGPLCQHPTRPKLPDCIGKKPYVGAVTLSR